MKLWGSERIRDRVPQKVCSDRLHRPEENLIDCVCLSVYLYLPDRGFLELGPLLFSWPHRTISKGRGSSEKPHPKTTPTSPPIALPPALHHKPPQTLSPSRARTTLYPAPPLTDYATLALAIHQLHQAVELRQVELQALLCFSPALGILPGLQLEDGEVVGWAFQCVCQEFPQRGVALMSHVFGVSEVGDLEHMQALGAWGEESAQRQDRQPGKGWLTAEIITPYPEACRPFLNPIKRSPTCPPI